MGDNPEEVVVKTTEKIKLSDRINELKRYISADKKRAIMLGFITLAIPITVVLALTQQDLFLRAAGFPTTPATPPWPTDPKPTPTPSNAYSRVFVTNNTYDGNLGGLSGADAMCQKSADTANLGGNWKAWLSDSTTSVASRFIHSDNPYKLLDGGIIANNWVDLTDGTLNFPININESGTQIGNSGNKVWTSTKDDGSIYSWSTNLLNSCNDWIDNSYGKFGTVGDANKTVLWSGNGDGDYCAIKNRLYCFEQSLVDEPTPTPTETPTPTFTPTPTPAPLKMTLNVAADAFVRFSSPNKNFGKSTSMEVDSNPNEISYLKFNLINLAGKKIVSAKLRLKVSDSSAKLLNLRRGSNVDWSETGITYNNRPGFDAIIRSFNTTAANSIIELDVKNAVSLRKGGKLYLGITSTGDDTGAFYSRESASSNRPQLVVEYR